MSNNTANSLLTRRIIIVLVSVAVGGTLYYLGTSALHAYFAKKFSPGAPPPAVVTAAKAELIAWQPEVSAVGTLRAVRGVDIAPELAGAVREVRFSSGEEVRAGQVLVELNIDADVAQQKALEAAAELAAVTVRRDTVQFEAQAISEAQLDASRADLKNKRALADAQRAVVAKKVLRAPFAGRVGIRTVNPGQYVNAGEKIVTLQAIDPILVDLTVPQQLAPQLAVGQSLRLETDAFPDKSFAGKLTAIAPKVDPNTRNVQIEAAVANSARTLLPGMFARVYIGSGSSAEQVTVPQTAVTYSAYGATAYVLDTSAAGKPPVARQVFVTPGPTRGDQVAIKSGIKAGDLVVTSGQLKIQSGSAVKIDNSVTLKNDPNPVPQEH